MLLALFTISHLFILTTANPFHKYPFVFLLDIGNEELKKTNSEQIRVSIPGGSLALRYPATGDGDTIAHVRVSGIDFGTDLKANILDGGPGYKYVVLVFMGNPGVPYDAVLTIQTIPSDKMYDDDQEAGDIDSGDTNKIDDANDSAEDTSDGSEVQISDKTNEEVVQASSNVYNYAQNDVIEADYDDDGNEKSDKEKDIHEIYAENLDQNYIKPNEEVKDYIEEGDNYQDDGQYSEDSRPNQYSANEDINEYDDSNKSEQEQIVDSNLYNRYGVLRPPLNGDGKRQDVSEQEENVESGYAEEDPGESDQMFNDEEVHNDGDNYKDRNNNINFDSYDSSAVPY